MSKYNSWGKLLSVGICHNDPIKLKCDNDNCINCFSPTCCGDHCDAHGDCLCIKTQCLCLGRK